MLSTSKEPGAEIVMTGLDYRYIRGKMNGKKGLDVSIGSYYLFFYLNRVYC